MAILFLIGTLGFGGTERQMVQIILGLHRRGHRVGLAVYRDPGPMAQPLIDAGIPIHSLGMERRLHALLGVWRLRQLMQREKFQILYSFLIRPNILAALLKKSHRKAVVVWGLRSSEIIWKSYGFYPMVDYWIKCRLANIPDRIIANAHAARYRATCDGMPGERIVVIPNGIDTDQFRPDPTARRLWRQKWRVADDAILIGLPGRIDPMKGHRIFLAAAAMIALEDSRLRFVCIGDGNYPLLQNLQRLAMEMGLAQRLLWAGHGTDMPGMYNALDIATSASEFGEGFSNTIGEAMACGVPCVVTNSGDAVFIVGMTGVVVPPLAPELLAEGWRTILDPAMGGLESLGEAARQRIMTFFSLNVMINRTEQTLLALTGPAMP